ncbi:MAG: TonB-dependent receptor, partial [Acidobacteria bacterium]|nr:TonB-dependent receptor [Acidobacteriota bacterium]
GPIIKNKTFFYASWFSERFPAGSFRRANVPTLQMRQGDFSQFSNPIRDPLTGTPFPNNMIPSGRLNPTSLKTQDLYIPEPNLGGPDSFTNNFGFAFPWPTDKFQTDQIYWRVDHQLTQKNSMFFRYSASETPYVLARSLPTFSWTRQRKYSKVALSDTHIFSPQLVNTFNFGWNGNYMFDGNTVDGFTPHRGDEAVAAIGLQGVNPKGLSEQGFPRMEINGLATLETVDGGLRDDHFDFSWDDALTWTYGSHVSKFGFQMYKYNDFDSTARLGTYGRFNFNGRFAGNAFGDFLLGLPNSSIRLDVLTPREMEAVEVGLFVMDTFKVTQNLTLDYGLRWDYYGSDTIKDGLQYGWDPASGNVTIPSGTESAVSPLYPKTISLVTGEVIPNASFSNLRPRVGLAYRITSDLVIRGGYGAFTERLNYFSRVQKEGPFEISETYFNNIENGQPLFAFPNPFPGDVTSAAIPSQSVVGYPRDTAHGVIHQFNVSVEKQVKDIGFRASYVGTRGRGLNYTLNTNKPLPSLTPFSSDRRPYSQFINTSVIRNDGSSNYNSMQLEVKRRVGAISFNAHYTLASNLHDWLNTQNPYDVTSHWSNDSFIARQRAVITTQTELPWGKGRHFLPDAGPALEALVGGWKVTTVSYFQTGPHFSPSFSGSDPSGTNTFGGLPDRICDGNIDNRSVEQWFDPSCFAAPPAGRFGNSGPNVLVAPGMNVHHLSLAKRFNVGERLGVFFTVAASNLFNHPHFITPRTNISTPGTGELFGGIQDWRAEKHASRKLQMKLRIEW